MVYPQYTDVKVKFLHRKSDLRLSFKSECLRVQKYGEKSRVLSLTIAIVKLSTLFILDSLSVLT